MKALAPAILLALAGATSACTFAYECDESQSCEFAIYHEDDVTPPNDGTRLAWVPWDAEYNNLPGEQCWTAWGEYLENAYDFCMDSAVGEDGKSDGPITVQRQNGGDKVSLRDGGDEAVDDSDPYSPVTYWKSGVNCPGASPPGK